jgi:branched-subunit amino acid ABC-type transport system permease component
VDDILSAVFRGMTFGSIYALLAVGLVLTYKAAGIFNLAFGAQAFAAGAVYYEARTRHDLPIPLAVVIALVFSALLGYLLDLMLFRHLRTAPPMTRLVVTLGLLVAIPEIVKLFFDVSTTFQPQGIVPDGSTAYNPFGEVFVSRDDLATAIVTVGLVLVLLALFRYSPLGLRMRAVVESTRMTELAGVNAGRISTTAWVMSSVLAGLAGILISPTLTQVSEIYYTPLVVAAISAAVLAALSNIGVAFVGGLLLGIISQVLAVELPTNSILATNLRPSLPFVALFLVLVFSPQLRNRKEVTDPLASVDPPPPALVSVERSDSLTWMTRVFGIVVGVFFFSWIFFSANEVWLYRTQYAVIYAVIFLSITVITGMAGEISLCQATFAGIGAFATAQLGTELGMSVLVAMLFAGVIAAAVGALVALPALRLGGIFLSLATFAFALFFDSVMVKFTWVSGGNGITPLETPRPLIGPIDFENEKAFLVLCLVILAIAGTLVVWVRGGTTGRFLDALRGSETAAASVGISPTRWRITAFALSAGIAGVGGGLLAMREQSANYNSSFVAQLGLVWVVIVVSLGSRTVEGAIQAAAGFIFFQRVVLEDWIPWIYNHAFVPALLILGAIVVYRLVTRRWTVVAAVAGLGIAGLVLYYLIGDPGWRVESVPTGLATVFFGLGAITYAKHPEGVLEHNKRASLARVQAFLDRRKARREGPPDATSAPDDAARVVGAPVGAGQ